MDTKAPHDVQNDLPEGGPLLRIPEAADLLSVSRRTLELWLNEGRLPFCHLGPRSRRILRSDLEEFVRSQRTRGGSS